MSEDGAWKISEKARAEAAAWLAEIDRRHAKYPKCKACGAPVIPGRTFCGRKTPEHDRLVVEAGWKR